MILRAVGAATVEVEASAAPTILSSVLEHDLGARRGFEPSFVSEI